MAKCPICNSRKGKRHCLLTEDLICSQCCGETRTEESCSACQFYQKPRRKYNDVPAFSIVEMDRNQDLASYGNAIEGALVAYDALNKLQLKDRDAIRIVELLIDKYHFQDQQLEQESPIVVNGVKAVDAAIEQDLAKVPRETIVRVLAVIRFVATRRTNIGREYMTVIHQFVGHRVATGVRALIR